MVYSRCVGVERECSHDTTLKTFSSSAFAGSLEGRECIGNDLVVDPRSGNQAWFPFLDRTNTAPWCCVRMEAAGRAHNKIVTNHIFILSNGILLLC